jgi:hypothetical protein
VLGRATHALERSLQQAKRGRLEVLREMKACLFFAGVPTNEVPPATWKKHFGLSTDKDASRAYASSVFPDQSNLWARKKDDGRAEAALIAYYGWRKK